MTPSATDGMTVFVSFHPIIGLGCTDIRNEPVLGAHQQNNLHLARIKARHIRSQTGDRHLQEFRTIDTATDTEVAGAIPSDNLLIGEQIYNGNSLFGLRPDIAVDLMRRKVKAKAAIGVSRAIVAKGCGEFRRQQYTRICRREKSP